jgi:hypothetical protein
MKDDRITIYTRRRSGDATMVAARNTTRAGIDKMIAGLDLVVREMVENIGKSIAIRLETSVYRSNAA